MSGIIANSERTTITEKTDHKCSFRWSLIKTGCGLFVMSHACVSHNHFYLLSSQYHGEKYPQLQQKNDAVSPDITYRVGYKLV